MLTSYTLPLMLFPLSNSSIIRGVLFFSTFLNTKFFVAYYRTVDEQHVLYIGRYGASPMLILKEVISTRITQILAEKKSSFAIPRVLQFVLLKQMPIFLHLMARKNEWSKLIRYCKNINRKINDD